MAESATEGLRQLCALAVMNARIGEACGVTGQAVAAWKSNKSKPGYRARLALQEKFGIAVGAWGTPANGTVIDNEPPRPRYTPPRAVEAALAAGLPDPRKKVLPLEPMLPPEPPEPNEEDDEETDETDSDERPSTIGEVRKVLSRHRKFAKGGNFMPAERARNRDTEIKLLTLLAKLERDAELLEDRIVREHPAWKRMKNAMMRALEKHPDALRDVVEALKEIE